MVLLKESVGYVLKVANWVYCLLGLEVYVKSGCYVFLPPLERELWWMGNVNRFYMPAYVFCWGTELCCSVCCLWSCVALKSMVFFGGALRGGVYLTWMYCSFSGRSTRENVNISAGGSGGQEQDEGGEQSASFCHHSCLIQPVFEVMLLFNFIKSSSLWGVVPLELRCPDPSKSLELWSLDSTRLNVFTGVYFLLSV